MYFAKLFVVATLVAVASALALPNPGRSGYNGPIQVDGRSVDYFHTCDICTDIVLIDPRDRNRRICSAEGEPPVKLYGQFESILPTFTASAVRLSRSSGRGHFSVISGVPAEGRDAFISSSVR